MKVQWHFLAFGQALGALDILSRGCMTKGFKSQAVVLIPFAGANVAFGDISRGEGLTQAFAQQIPKKMVIAIPLPLVVQGNDEKVGALEILKDEGRRRSLCFAFILP